MNGAQATPTAVGGYRASAEPVLHKIREVADHKQSAKQMLW
jgi:hypothetical protein